MSMVDIFSHPGLLSCRAGVSFVSDLLIARHPCVLIPSFAASILRRRHSAGVQKFVAKGANFRHLTPINQGQDCPQSLALNLSTKGIGFRYGEGVLRFD